MSVISYLYEVPGDITFKVSHLHMFPYVLRCLKSIGKVTITADQYGYIVEVVPGEMKQVCCQHDVNALFHRDTLRQLGSSQANLQIGCLTEDIKELLLLPVSLGSLAGVLEDIVIIGAEQSPRSTELGGELSKVEVSMPTVIPQGVIKIA